MWKQGSFLLWAGVPTIFCLDAQYTRSRLPWEKNGSGPCGMQAQEAQDHLYNGWNLENMEFYKWTCHCFPHLCVAHWHHGSLRSGSFYGLVLFPSFRCVLVESSVRPCWARSLCYKLQIPLDQNPQGKDKYLGPYSLFPFLGNPRQAERKQWQTSILNWQAQMACSSVAGACGMGTRTHI